MTREQPAPLEIGSRRELFVDRYLVDKFEGAGIVAARPHDEGIVCRWDRPWEGRYTGYATVLQLADGSCRLYYSGCPRYRSDHDLDRQACVLLSSDGAHWERPDLGLFEVHGTRNNNVVLDEAQLALNFTPFLDRDGVPAEERFKAVGGTRFTGLVLFASPDGLHWHKLFDGEPVLRGEYLDSMNRLFWSEAEGCYVLYARLWKGGWEGYRWIGRAVSRDLRHWSELRPVRILHAGRDVPDEHYYHNGVCPYFRAPHLHIALCSQLTEGAVLRSEQVGALDLEDPRRADARGGGGLLVSREGGVFERTFMEDFIRPPPGPANWIARCNYPAAGLAQTGPGEMSLYTVSHSGLPAPVLRRHSLRLDGFASLRAPFAGGWMVTRPFVFGGHALVLNYATSSRGSLRLQFEDPNGEPLEGYRLRDCEELVGNELDRLVAFDGSTDVSPLSDRPVRLRVAMRDADLYSLQFAPGE
jgi:hypothetical protein